MNRHITWVNERGDKVMLIMSEELIAKLIDVMYPDYGPEFQTKGRIELQKFFGGKA